MKKKEKKDKGYSPIRYQKCHQVMINNTLYLATFELVKSI